MLLRNSRFYEVNKENHKFLFSNDDKELPPKDAFIELLTNHINVNLLSYNTLMMLL